MQFYQPKKVQFCHAFTNTSINLGVYSTQRNESYHVIVKRNLNKNLTVSAAIEALVSRTSELAEDYNERINKDHRNTPILMDQQAFKNIKSLLTYYAIYRTNSEYMQSKVLAEEIKSGEKPLFEFDEAIGCTFECQLPARYQLPCQHWMMPFYLEDKPLLISLFHSYWLLDGPLIVQSWKMLISSSQSSLESSCTPFSLGISQPAASAS